MTQFLTIGLCLSLGLNFYMLYEFHSTKAEMEHINNLVNIGDHGQSLIQRMQGTQHSILLVENNLKEVNAQFPDLKRQIAEMENAIDDQQATLNDLKQQKITHQRQLKQFCLQNNLRACNF